MVKSILSSTFTNLVHTNAFQSRYLSRKKITSITDEMNPLIPLQCALSQVWRVQKNAN